MREWLAGAVLPSLSFSSPTEKSLFSLSLRAPLCPLLSLLSRGRVWCGVAFRQIFCPVLAACAHLADAPPLMTMHRAAYRRVVAIKLLDSFTIVTIFD